MNMAVVGAARVVFGADTSEFDAGAKGVEGVLGRLVDKFHDVEQRIKNIGAGVTLGVTVPFAAMVRAVDKGAGSFQAQMNRVRAALQDASPEQIDQLAVAARTLGPAVNKGATEAAGAIDALARAGVSAADILGGALDATLKLSAAGMVDGAAAAGLVTDIMGQFGKTASDLPEVMTNVIGALDSTKMNFDDFRLAVGQGGAMAAAAGVSFEDFATGIAATSTQFTSGADAGTSFKTYLQTLTGKSKEARAALAKLGIEFYDSAGRIKPLAEQARILHEKLGDLTDESKQNALNPIFGADAARTAIGLANQGREGFEKFRDAVANGDVDAKLKIAAQGSEAAGKRIAVAWESVKNAIGLDTGLLDITTAIKNGFARMLEAIANAPAGVKQVGAAFAALGAIMGPLLMVVGHVGAIFLANFAAAKFGLIGRALGLIISPVSTIISMLGEFGLSRVLMMVGSRLLALAGPVGWAVSAFLLFKDHIISALSMVWTEITQTLGPPIEAIMAKFEAIWAKLSGGSIGGAIEGLMSLLGGLRDFIGTGLQAAIVVAGEVIERTLAAIVAAFSGFVDVVSGVIDLISALLSGDFAGAWNAIVGIIESVFGAIVDIAAAFVPELGNELQQVYMIAKAWLADGFNSIVGWFSGAVKSGVDYVAKTFPGVVAAAKAVYDGVKAWLVDAFGGIMSFVSGAVKWIVDQYGKVKKFLGLGEATSAPAAPPPAKPAPATAPPASAPKRTVDFDDEGGGKKKAGGAGRKGRDTSHDQQNRDQLEFQVQMDAARLRGDVEAEAALRRKMELSRQIEAYQRTGLSLAAATAAATRDMATLEAARREGMAKDLERDETAHQIDLARISGNRTLEETLQRQQELKERINGFLRDGLSLTEATARAARQQLETDQARAAVRARLLADDEQDRQLRLAQARGDSEERIRQLQREIDIRNRQRELERDWQQGDEDPRTRAEREWSEEDKARQTGAFRETFKDGVRAALDGDLKGWIKNWWKDRVAKGMEEALNSLADLIASLFSKGGTAGGGGGIGGAIASIVGSIFGKKTAATPGFATGGSFRVGGRSGIDQNLVSFRATAGEIVNITRPGNDNGPQGAVNISMPITFSGAMDLATKTEAARFAEAARQAAIQGVMEAQRRRG